MTWPASPTATTSRRRTGTAPLDASSGDQIRHRLGQRGADGLPSLVAALPAATETARGVAFSVLLGLGAAAVEAVEPLGADIELAPFRTVLRVVAGVATEDELVAADPEGGSACSPR